MGLASRHLFHEDFEVSVFTDGTDVVDDVFVFQSGMKCNLFMQRLHLSASHTRLYHCITRLHYSSCTSGDNR